MHNMQLKDKWVSAYMDTAKRFAELSTAHNLKVGAVIVKDHKIISIGYNGTPSGWDNSCENMVTEKSGEISYFRLVTKPEVIHAEANAICKLARSNERGDGSVLFCTHSPCIECAKLIYASGISTVYYDKVYRDDSGLNFLIASGITCYPYQGDSI
jgi:dCMP deaminase